MSLLLGIVLFIVLTVVTQIGGIALLIAWLLVELFGSGDPGRLRRRLELVGAFVLTYMVMTIFIIPPLAALGGRVPLACSSGPEYAYAAGNPLFCVLNRNYVNTRLKSLLENLSRYMKITHPGTTTVYLDANFPFFDGFPLVPHLSHNDGRKLDLGFYYQDASGRYLPGELRSPIGYWAFEQPVRREDSVCPGNEFLTLRWDMGWLQPLFPNWKLDVERTRDAVNWLTTAGREFGIDRLFMEPHMAQRLSVSSPILKFQGCKAARHDDHIHLQISR
jgi:hypothetical protein